MAALTVGELQVILSGDMSRLNRDLDRIDNRVAATEKKHTASWQRTGASAAEAIRAGMLVAERDADKIGDRTGGVLAQGIRSGMIRRSPLIAAAIGGALIAGAPLVMAGAAAMFAGVGAVAAAQTVEVRSAWSKLGKDITAGAVADSAVLVPVYVSMAKQIGDAFEDVRPQLREAFADSAPLIQKTTDGIIALGQNAMPGLVRAIAAGGPVFDGLEDFLASTGTGLTDFFDAISSHSPAAGTAFASLGDILGDLLPILGELLGQGAELASIVLPPLADVLGVTAEAAGALGPLLPAIVLGFTAMKVVNTINPHLATMGSLLGTLGQQGGKAGKALDTAGSAMHGFGKALPLIAATMAAFTLSTDTNEDRVSEWTDTLIKGGQAADDLRAKFQEAKGQGFFEDVFGDTSLLFGDLWDDEHYANIIEDFEAADAAARGSADAQRENVRAAAELARQEQSTAFAIQGVTAAMIAQGAQAMAALDSGFAYRNSLDALEDAQAALNTAIVDQGAGSEAAQRAQLALEQQSYATALAFGQQQADLSGLSEDSEAYKRLVQEEMLRELHKLHDAAGPEMKAAIGQQIAALQASGVTLVGTANAAAATADQMRDLGLKVTQIPGNKTVFIDAPTAEQKKRLEDLGMVVRYLPNGKVYVTADTSPAEGTLAAFLNQRRTMQVQVNLAQGTRLLGGFTNASGQQARAMGGPVAARLPYLVGEEGQEMFVPDVPGTIIDAKKTAAMLAAAGNQRAAAMLPPSISGSTTRGARGSGSSAFGAAGQGAGNEYHKHYELKATVDKTVTLRELIALQREADALYG